MKIFFSILACTFLSTQITLGQSLNWNNPEAADKHLAYINFGYDYGLVTQVGYGYKIFKKSPLWLQADFSRPMGGDGFDDFKTRLGIQYRAFQSNRFSIITRVHGNYRSHQNEFAYMKSFGAEASGVLGWYQAKWFVEFEFGFDKAIVTQIKHQELFTDNYANVNDGWYLPTGGNYFYGIKFSRSLGKGIYASIDLGATAAEAKDKDALLPIYLKLGILKTFK